MSTPVETQPERTALAWQRTGLGILAVAGLLGHRAVRDEDPAALVTAGLAALVGLGVLGGLAPLRYRRPGGRRAGSVSESLARAVTGAVVLVAVLAAVAILTRR